MSKSYSVTDARAHLGAILSNVQAGRVVQLTRRGRPVAKRTRFEFEDEWRLMIHYSGQLKPIGPQLRFDVFASGSVLKSYFECPIDPRKDLKRVIVGHREAALNEPVVKMLLEKREWKRVLVHRGSSALRG